MDPVWCKPELSDVIIGNGEIFDQTRSIITDIMSGHIDVTHLIENMAGVLTSKEAEHREKGMQFFTKILKELPKDYFTEMQINFISKFYIDRLKDHHTVIPSVIEGYLSIIQMSNYNVMCSGEFITILFREVPCQSQVRQDRYNIFLILQILMDKNVEYMKKLGPDFVYGVISAIDGERDPRNLMFLFQFLPNFIENIPLGHLVEEMFDVISCYYPIDFYPSPNDPAAVTRQDLADALCPCLCAAPEFGEQCLVLLVEKLDSSLRLAKIDSLKLLSVSCKTFKAESYGPFLKTLWSTISKDIMHKTDEELKIASHEALYALVAKMATIANTDQTFENFVKAILISMQTVIAESTTVQNFVKAAKVLATTANASKESCIIITRSMIPATIAFYGFKTSTKLQVASLDYLGDLYDLAKHWSVLDQIEGQVNEIPPICLTAVSQPLKEYQVAGFKTLIRVKKVLKTEFVLPFVEILIHNVKHAHDNDLLSVSVETIHAIARMYPELIMSLVVKEKCNLDNLTADKTALQKRLGLLSNLASIDDFTKIIIEEMLKIITTNDKEALKVVEVLSESMSNSSLYTKEKVSQIESDHGLVDSILNWLYKEISTENKESLAHGYSLISNTIGSLPAEKQLKILSKHTTQVLENCLKDDVYFLILESLYSSLRQSVVDTKFEEIMIVSVRISLTSENSLVRTKACVLIAHILNKAEYGQHFELLYELLKSNLTACSRQDSRLCPRLIELYGWLTKALIMRGSDAFMFWFQKLVAILSNSDYCKHGSEAVRLIMTEQPDHLSIKQHCRISLLYKQRMFVTFGSLVDKLGPFTPECKESYLLCWAYILEKTPKTVLNNEANKIAPIVIDSLDHDHKELLTVMIDVLCHFIETKHSSIPDSLQTILPRLVNLTKYVKSMDVRIKSLQCLHDIANTLRTATLLPYKQDVLLDIAPSLDDKKRLVRNVAVRARTRWFLVGAPGEDKEN